MATVENFRQQAWGGHLHCFGLQKSYPINNATGYAYEPWHWRFRSG
ncbi:D-alanyl-D-alanine carboxypeptidase family protein [Pseudomonas sp.]